MNKEGEGSGEELGRIAWNEVMDLGKVSFFEVRVTRKGKEVTFEGNLLRERRVHRVKESKLRLNKVIGMLR